MNSDPEQSRQHAQGQYKAVRAKLGRKPSLPEYIAESGISKRNLQLIYGRNAFNRLVTECGDEATKFGKTKSDLRQILQQWGELARELKTLPFLTDWDQKGYSPRSSGIRSSHGIGWPQMPAAFLREFGSDPAWSDVVASIPPQPNGTVHAAGAKIDPVPAFVSQFVPPIIAELAVLSRDEDRAHDFEEKVNLVFQMLGFQVMTLGQGTGRNPDAIARAAQEHYALLIDAKARRQGYVMGTEDRKFGEYIRRYEPVLARDGISKLYFVIVSSGFSGRDMPSIMRVKQETQVPVVEITAAQLLRILAFAIENPSTYNRSQFEFLTLKEGELADATINKILKTP